MYRGKKLRMTAELLLAKTHARSQCKNILKILKDKENCQSRLLHPVKIAFKNASEMNTFSRHTKAERIYHQQIYITRSVQGNPLDRRKMTLDGNKGMKINK